MVKIPGFCLPQTLRGFHSSVTPHFSSASPVFICLRSFIPLHVHWRPSSPAHGPSEYIFFFSSFFRSGPEFALVRLSVSFSLARLTWPRACARSFPHSSFRADPQPAYSPPYLAFGPPLLVSKQNNGIRKRFPFLCIMRFFIPFWSDR